MEKEKGASPRNSPKSDSKEQNVEVGVMEMLKNAIGLDLTRFTVPVTFNEPTTFLQRMMEVTFHHLYLLDKADSVATHNPDLALLYVAVHSLSVFGNGVQRVKHKPFNPMLGETYEFQRGGVKFIAEQVSHHPPIGASYIENDHFEIHFFLGVETKFTGNSVYSKPFSTTLVRLKSNGATFIYEGVTSAAHNIILGSRWVDIYGKVRIQQLDSPRFCKLVCKQCDFFSTTWHMVEGTCYSKENTPAYAFEGRWNSKIYAKKGKGGKFSTKSTDGLEVNTEAVPNFENNAVVCLWESKHQLSTETPYPRWDMTKLARKSCALKEKYYISKSLPVTDSRLRPDRIALEKLDFDAAAKEKEILEQNQREEQKNRHSEWIPRYFETAEIDGKKYFKYLKNYGS